MQLDQVDTIMITTDRLCNSVDNTQELVKQARQLAQVAQKQQFELHRW